MAESLTVAVIPARMESSRLPGKVLADLGGAPLVWRVYEQVRSAHKIGRVIVATDSADVADAVIALGGEAVLTSTEHPSGTDRIAEAIRSVQCELVLNVQGDEPFVEPAMLDALVGLLQSRDDWHAATAVSPFAADDDVDNPHIVKAVLSKSGRALYFSRSKVPFERQTNRQPYYHHHGVYIFRKHFLETFVGLKPGPLEQAEALEQLRILENDYSIGALIWPRAGIGVDTPEDLEAARRRFSKR